MFSEHAEKSELCNFEILCVIVFITQHFIVLQNDCTSNSFLARTPVYLSYLPTHSVSSDQEHFAPPHPTSNPLYPPPCSTTGYTNNQRIVTRGGNRNTLEREWNKIHDPLYKTLFLSSMTHFIICSNDWARDWHTHTHMHTHIQHERESERGRESALQNICLYSDN